MSGEGQPIKVARLEREKPKQFLTGSSSKQAFHSAGTQSRRMYLAAPMLEVNSIYSLGSSSYMIIYAVLAALSTASAWVILVT